MSTIPQDLSEFRQPGRGRGLLDVFGWRYLLRLLVRQGTQTRYRNSVLGWTWSYVKPAVQFAVFYVVIGRILRVSDDVDLFAVHLFAGIVMVNFFTEAFGNATRSIVDNGALVKKIYLPRELFPIAAIIVAFVHFLPQAVILLAVCVVLGWTPTLAGVGAMVLAVLLVAAMALGLGMFLGSVNVAFRDAQNFVDLIVLFATWTVPALYTWQLAADQLPASIFHVYMSNPLAVAVDRFQEATWRATAENPLPPPEHMTVYTLVALGICAALLVLGQLVFRRFERRFAQEL